MNDIFIVIMIVGVMLLLLIFISIFRLKNELVRINIILEKLGGLMGVPRAIRR